jgi:hypothetical protein
VLPTTMNGRLRTGADKGTYTRWGRKETSMNLARFLVGVAENPFFRFHEII